VCDDYEFYDIDKELCLVAGSEDLSKVSVEDFIARVNKLPSRKRHEFFYVLRLLFGED